MKRILIIGSGGAGKSTLAGKLGEAVGIPVTHLDKLYWQSGWIEPDKAEWREKVLKPELEKETWIMDGNFGGTMEMRLAYADTVIFLDLPRSVCVRRIIKRWLKYHGTNRPDMTEGCNEKLDLAFLAWIWNYAKRTKPKVESRIKKSEDSIVIVRLRSQKEIDGFVRRISKMQKNSKETNALKIFKN